MKGFSVLLIIVSLNTFAFGHPSCEFFEKDAISLFKLSKSNEHKALLFSLKTTGCNFDRTSKISVYFKESNGICSIPTFTYIRNVIGYKNYSDMTKNILSNNELFIPKIKDLVMSKKAKSVAVNLYQTPTGCKADSYIKFTGSTLSFDHIYQEVDYLSVKNVEIYKSGH